MYIRLEEVLPVHEIRNVKCDLDPCLDGLDLLVVLGVVACEDDFSGSKLGRERSLGRSSCGNIGDLPSVHITRTREGGTCQEVLEDSVGLWVGEELGETDERSLHDDISDVRMLSEKSMGNGDRGKVV